MSNIKHTPGPWESFVIPSKHFESTEFTIQIRAEHPEFPMYHRIVSNIGLYDYSDNEREANAKLIAAAPELLEALKEAEYILREDNRTFEADTALAVIKKATE